MVLLMLLVLPKCYHTVTIVFSTGYAPGIQYDAVNNQLRELFD